MVRSFASWGKGASLSQHRGEGPRISIALAGFYANPSPIVQEWPVVSRPPGFRLLMWKGGGYLLSIGKYSRVHDIHVLGERTAGCRFTMVLRVISRLPRLFWYATIDLAGRWIAIRGRSAKAIANVFRGARLLGAGERGFIHSPRGVWLDDSISAVLVRHVLYATTFHGGRFDVPIRIDRKTEFEQLIASPSSKIFCGAHFALNAALQRVLDDMGVPFATISGDAGVSPAWLGPPYSVWGRAKYVERIAVSPRALLAAKAAIRAGKSVVAEIDRLDMPKVPGTKYRHVEPSPNMLAFAALLGIPVVFFAAKLSGEGEIVIAWEGPRQLRKDDPRDLDDALESFRRFIARFLPDSRS